MRRIAAILAIGPILAVALSLAPPRASATSVNVVGSFASSIFSGSFSATYDIDDSYYNGILAVGLDSLVFDSPLFPAGQFDTSNSTMDLTFNSGILTEVIVGGNIANAIMISDPTVSDFRVVYANFAGLWSNVPVGFNGISVELNGNWIFPDEQGTGFVALTPSPAPVPSSAPSRPWHIPEPLSIWLVVAGLGSFGLSSCGWKLRCLNAGAP